MPAHPVPSSICPACEAVFALAGDVPGNTGNAPEPGNLTVCIECACVMRFGNDLQLVEMTHQEIMALSPDVQMEILRIRNAIITVNEEQRRKSVN